MPAKLKPLLEGVVIPKWQGDKAIEIRDIAIDSRKVEPGDLFVAIPGVNQDGYAYVHDAIARGAIAILADRTSNDIGSDIVQIQVSDVRETYAMLCARFFDNPSEELRLVGVTGTNGKTSVSTMLYDLFKGMGYKVGLISTIEILIADKVYPTSHTTPDAYVLNQILAQMVREGVSHVFMEVSSHALAQSRVSGLDFDIAIFTNLSHDHLDYHGTFLAYRDAKKLLFDKLSKEAIAIVNIDDKNGEVMIQNCRATQKRCSALQLTDYRVKILSSSTAGLQLQLDNIEVFSPLVGRFNAYNLLFVYAAAVELEASEDNIYILARLSLLRPPKGRMEVVSMRPRVIVDFAHTPDALLNVLQTIQKEMHEGKMIVVIGCGGDRDKQKRPTMGSIAAQWADRVILTSDNPRNEDPIDIIQEMKSELTITQRVKVIEIVDRKMAIASAIELADPIDTVLVAGKGHEAYQEIQGQRIEFSDQEEIQKILNKDIEE